MNRKNLIKVYAAMFFAIIFWGFSFVWSKQVLAVYEPITVIYFRLILSVIFLFVVGKLFRKLQRIERKHWKSFLFIAFFEPFAYFIGENFGLTHVSSTVASVLVATIPLFSPFAAFLIHKEKISILNFAGIVLSIIGVVMVILKNDLGIKADFWGLLFMMLAVFSAVAYSVAVVNIADRYNVYTIITVQNFIGILLFTPIFFISEYENFIQIPFSWEIWLPLIELAVFASTFAFMLFTYGIRVLGVTKANTLANFIPVITAVYAFWVLGETLSWLNILGIVVVIVGLIISQIKLQKVVYEV